MDDLRPSDNNNRKTLLEKQPILQIDDLCTEFETELGVVTAVDHVSMKVDNGETVGIVGESGSGKTVTMLSVMRLIESPPGRIISGQVLFRGQDLLTLRNKEMRQIRGGEIAMIFQDPLTSLNHVYSIGEQLTEPIRLHLGLSKRVASEKAAESLAQVGIPDPERALDAYPHQFSGGMRQRVMIAMAISCNPSLLIADEPTTALDVTVQKQLLALIDGLRSDLGLSVVWITHDLGVIAGLADRVMVMYAGEVVEHGPTIPIFENPCHPYTQGLMCSIPRMDTPCVERLEPIKGSAPYQLSRIEGCQFASRCQYRIERCEEKPPLIDISADHASRCWVNPEFKRSHS